LLGELCLDRAPSASIWKLVSSVFSSARFSTIAIAVRTGGIVPYCFCHGGLSLCHSFPAAAAASASRAQSGRRWIAARVLLRDIGLEARRWWRGAFDLALGLAWFCSTSTGRRLRGRGNALVWIATEQHPRTLGVEVRLAAAVEQRVEVGARPSGGRGRSRVARQSRVRFVDMMARISRSPGRTTLNWPSGTIMAVCQPRPCQYGRREAQVTADGISAPATRW